MFSADGMANSARSIPIVGSLFGAGATATGAVAVGAATFTREIVSGYAGLLKSAMIPLFVAGFTLAVVLPMLPLIIWSMGVISWMLFFIECLLISPMWLAAHGTAEQEGWGTEHTRQGYMLMLGLFLNPVLRTAGFFAIFLALVPLKPLVGWVFSALIGVMVTGWMSLGIVVFAPLLVAFFAYSAGVRIFSLPSELFERGLRWVNAGQEVTGDSSAESHNRTLVAGFSHSTAGTAQGKLTDLGPMSPRPSKEKEHGDFFEQGKL